MPQKQGDLANREIPRSMLFNSQLKMKFHGHLADARAVGRNDISKVTRCETTHGITELRVIEYVEKLTPNVQRHPLIDMNVLEK
jgi:hypothetical protein